MTVEGIGWSSADWSPSAQATNNWETLSLEEVAIKEFKIIELISFLSFPDRLSRKHLSVR